MNITLHKISKDAVAVFGQAVVMKTTTGLMKRLFGVAICVLGICLATTTRSLASDWYFVVDENPQEIAPGEWSFAVEVPKSLKGKLKFVSSQYNFEEFTEGIEVDYDFDHARRSQQVNDCPEGIDFCDYREFLAIAPTLYNELDGSMNGWDGSDLKDRMFSGVVYSTAPLISVYLTIEAEKP